MQCNWALQACFILKDSLATLKLQNVSNTQYRIYSFQENEPNLVPNAKYLYFTQSKLFKYLNSQSNSWPDNILNSSDSSPIVQLVRIICDNTVLLILEVLHSQVSKQTMQHPGISFPPSVSSHGSGILILKEFLMYIWILNFPFGNLLSCCKKLQACNNSRQTQRCQQDFWSLWCMCDWYRLHDCFQTT